MTFIGHRKMDAKILVFVVVEACVCFGYHPFEKEDIGTLAGDVQNWAMLIQNYILQVTYQGLPRQFEAQMRDLI